MSALGELGRLGWMTAVLFLAALGALIWEPVRVFVVFCALAQARAYLFIPLLAAFLLFAIIGGGL